MLLSNLKFNGYKPKSKRLLDLYLQDVTALEEKMSSYALAQRIYTKRIYVLLHALWSS